MGLFWIKNNCKGLELKPILKMTSDPAAHMSFISDPKKPVGGHILAHASQTRVMVSIIY